MERLEEDALLHPAPVGEDLEVAVAEDGVGHASERGHHRVHQALAPLRRAKVLALGLRVDEVREDGLRRAGRLAPEVGLLADHLVGVRPLREPDHADLREAEPLAVRAGAGRACASSLMRLESSVIPNVPAFWPAASTSYASATFSA